MREQVLDAGFVAIPFLYPTLTQEVQQQNNTDCKKDDGRDEAQNEFI